MCGLIGFITAKSPYTKSQYQEKRGFFEDGLILASLRGWDSTGIAAVMGANKSPAVYKKAVNASDFILLKTADKIMYGADQALAMFGHARSSTRGSISDENAHPFQYKHITLVHNGVVHNHKQIARECDSDVDSAHVAYALSETADPLEVLQAVDGDYCFIWHDAKEGTLNIVRNPGRPLVHAYIPEWNGIAFASEQGALAHSLGRHGVDIRDHYWTFKEHQLWSWKLGDKLEFTTRPFVPSRGRWRALPPRQESSADGTHTPAATRDWEPTGARTPSTGSSSSSTISTTDRARLQGLVKTKHTNTGRPTGAKQIKKATQKLRGLNLVYDTSYGVMPAGWVPYKNQRGYGTMLGTMKAGTHSGRKVEFPNISKEIYDELDRGSHNLVADLVNLKQHNKEFIIIGEICENTLDRVKDSIARRGRSLKSPGSEGPPKEKTFRGPGGVFITEERFNELTKDGCQSCTGTVDPLFSDKVIWFADQPICHSCAGDPVTLADLGVGAPQRAVH